MPTQMRLNSLVAQQTRVCYLCVTLSRLLENHLPEEVCSHIENRQPLRAPCFQSKQEQWTFLQGLTSKVNKSPSSTQKQPPFLLIRVGKTQTALPGPLQPQSPKTNKQREKKKKKEKKPLSRLTSSLFSLCRVPISS